jgi:hypothetical protein
VALVGPSGLDQLDRILVSVRDDIRGRKPITAGGPTPEEIGRQVWGPYRFTPGVDGAERDGRQVILLDLRLGDQQPFAMERTRPPSWDNDTTGAWWRRYAEQPLWLTLGCYRKGYELWTVPLRVEVERP